MRSHRLMLINLTFSVSNKSILRRNANLLTVSLYIFWNLYMNQQRILQNAIPSAFLIIIQYGN